MWRALRAELIYNRPVLLGALGIAVGVVAILTVVFGLVGGEGPQPHIVAGIRAMFLVMAPLIAGFVAQGNWNEEKRSRLLLAGDLTPLDIAGAQVLLPVGLLVVGGCCAALLLVAEGLISGQVGTESMNMPVFVGGQIFVYVELALLAKEAAVARRQNRRRAATLGWLCFGGTILLLTVLYSRLTLAKLGWIHLVLGHAVVAALAMGATMSLFVRRTDFTR